MQEVEKIEKYWRKEVVKLEEILMSMHVEIGVKHNESEIFQDEVSYCEHENTLIEEEI